MARGVGIASLYILIGCVCGVMAIVVKMDTVNRVQFIDKTAFHIAPIQLGKI